MGLLEWLAVFIGLLFSSPGDLSKPGIEPVSPRLLYWRQMVFTTEPPRKPKSFHICTCGINSQKWNCLIKGLTEFLIWIHTVKFPFNECHFTLNTRRYENLCFPKVCWTMNGINQTLGFSNLIRKNEISMTYDFFFLTISDTDHLLLWMWVICISFCFVNCLDMPFLYFSTCLFPF